MQQVGKHCWCSPKSGIILAESTWQNVLVPDSDYKFLQMRDPYNRVVSMFLNKIVDIDVRHLADVKRERWVPWIDVPDPYDDINSRAEVYKNYLTHTGPGCYRLPLDPNKNLLDYTFRDFVFNQLQLRQTILANEGATAGSLSYRDELNDETEEEYGEVLDEIENRFTGDRMGGGVLRYQGSIGVGNSQKNEEKETEEPNNYSTRNKSLLKCMKSVLYII